MPALPRRNNEAELEAFGSVCDRLSGFDPALDPEFVDGFLTALAAGPGMPPPEEWLPALAGDAFDRTFADPPDRLQALRALKARVAVLLDQLDPEWLCDAPDVPRLEPWVMEWTDESRQAATGGGRDWTPEELARLRTGVRWGEGLLAGAAAFPERWALPPAGDPAGDDARALWAQVESLVWADDDARWADLPGPRLADRNELIDQACFALQELRLWWVDALPPPAQRRVEPLPGRNDPCPCGSGRKFKKCHGA